ncbi:MAG TPA: hypothetical protein VJ553_04935 [Candidatus Paceibacterota bacterium]|nr:hypothetical protein [Candidatus Paceibacterota bacterium]
MNETVAHELQRRYLEGEGRALSGLYAELRFMAAQILRGCPGGAEVAHHAAARLVERYMRNPGHYRIHHFGFMVSREVAHALLYGGNGHREPHDAELTFEPASIVERGDAIHPVDYATDLQRTEIGRRALLDLWSSWGYQRAVLTIAEYAGRAWIYARAVQLHTVYRMMHRGQKIRARQPGRGSVGRDATAVQGVRAELQLCCQPHAPALESREAAR